MKPQCFSQSELVFSDTYQAISAALYVYTQWHSGTHERSIEHKKVNNPRASFSFLLVIYKRFASYITYA